MPAKKLPWRTIIASPRDEWGRFKRRELDEAILEAKAMREAEAARKKRQSRARGRERQG